MTDFLNNIVKRHHSARDLTHQTEFHALCYFLCVAPVSFLLYSHCHLTSFHLLQLWALCTLTTRRFHRVAYFCFGSILHSPYLLYLLISFSFLTIPCFAFRENAIGFLRYEQSGRCGIKINERNIKRSKCVWQYKSIKQLKTKKNSIFFLSFFK